MIQKIYKSIFPRTRVSHPVSKLLRPWLEKKRLRAILGGTLVLSTFNLSVLLYPPKEPVRAMMDLTNIELKTDEVTVNPLPNYIGISQGFHAFHRGIDLRAPKGSPIYPIKKGVVIKVKNSSYGYGRHVIVDHGGNLYSLYAHMGKIFVEEGERINPSDKLGEVGLTGHTTGYHLHLEVRKGFLAINPLPYLR